MALLEAACQVLASPPDRSHTFRWAANAVSDRECHQAPCRWSRASRTCPMCVAAVVNVYVTATRGCGNGPLGPQ
eukprot:scaffold87773_cov60-Phaeocystis_antarctica.AAC.2